jgi:hypothetical protein
LNDQTGIETMIALNSRDWDMQSHINTINRVTLDSTILSEIKRDMYDLWKSININVGVNHKFNKASRINLGVDYLYYYNDFPNLLDNQIVYQQTGLTDNEKIEIIKKTPIDFMIGRLDYDHNFSQIIHLESGLKTSFSILDNNVKVQKFLNGDWQPYPEFTNHSNLTEWIAAAYLTFKLNFSEKFNMNGGMRYEYTDTEISTPEQKGLVEIAYGNFFPNLVLQRKFSDQSSLQIGYYRRITRPTYNDLAPFVTFFNTNSLTDGNVYLLPAILEGIKLDYGINQLLVSFNYGYTDNHISRFQPEIDKVKNFQIWRTRNLDYSKNYSLTIALPFSLRNWWELHSNLTGSYTIYKTSHLEVNDEHDIFGLNLNLVSNFILPKDISMEITWRYQSGMHSGLLLFEPLFNLNFGIQKKFSKNRGALTLAANDILDTNIYKYKLVYPDRDVNYYGSMQFSMPSAKITYTKSFGNSKLKKVEIKSGSEAEKRRVE